MRVIQALSGLALLAAFAQAQTGVPTYKGSLAIRPLLSNGKCLTAASNTNGAAVTIQDCTGADNQKWIFQGGSVKVFGSAKCLDVPSGNTANGVKLQIWGCNAGNPNQAWYYNFWDEHLSWSGKGKCLDLTSGNLANGNRVQTWACQGEGNFNQVWYTGYQANQLPTTSQNGQYGINNCGTTNSQTSKCQTAWINSASDFCLWAPPTLGTVGDSERITVAYCTKSGRGTRTIPNGTLKGVHFVKTPDYVQVTGVGDFTKINVPNGDQGGELDPHGPDGNGNPVGGLVYGNGFGSALQYHEWTSFISHSEFCFRACVGSSSPKRCNHIYDVMGCWWNMPANYGANVFENCVGNSANPMGIYGTYTWHQGISPTPSAHPVPASSSCTSLPSITASPLRRRGDNLRFQRDLSPQAS